MFTFWVALEDFANDIYLYLNKITIISKIISWRQ